MVSPDHWKEFPRRLQQLQAKYYCAIGTHPDEATDPADIGSFIQNLCSEFFPGVRDPPVMTCNLAQAARASGFLYRLGLYKEKPPYQTIVADRAGPEYEVRVDIILPTSSYRRPL